MMDVSSIIKTYFKITDVKSSQARKLRRLLRREGKGIRVIKKGLKK